MSQFAFADLLLRDAAALLIVKATVVLALASVAAIAAKRFSAARRHMLWLVALSSCAWLVLSSPVVPAIVIHAPILALNTVTTATRLTVRLPLPSGGATMANASPVRQQFPRTEASRRASIGSMPLPSHPLIAIWIIGCIVLLVRQAIGFAGATRLARRASVASDGGATRELASAAAMVGVRRQIFLGYSTEVESPITFGIATPFVLLPVEATSWSAERRRAVLLHEAAHISRGDCLSQAIGRLTCALFWFHPLVWRAFAHLRAEAERAADDCVLNEGIPAPEYATHLLELASRLSNARPNLVAVGIVSTTHLERRFLAMFDTKRSRARVTSRAQTMTATFALAMICPFASLRVVASAPPRHALVHPDMSGRWTSDTVEIRTQEFDFSVLDSATIKQTGDAISVEAFGHILSAQTHILMQTHNFSQQIPFDGAASTATVVTGNRATKVVVYAVWERDTLVITSHAEAGGQVLHTTERMTLSPNGKTISTRNVSFLNGEDRWGGAITSVLRRMAP